MRLAALCCLLLFASPAFAKDITLTLNDDEQRGMIGMLDAAVKATGLQGAETGLYFQKKIIEAQRAPAPAGAPAQPAAQPAPLPEKK